MVERYWNSRTLAPGSIALLLSVATIGATVAAVHPSFVLGQEEPSNRPESNGQSSADNKSDNKSDNKPDEKFDEKSDDEPQPRTHQRHDIEGWSVHVDQQLLEGEHVELGQTALKVVGQQLYLISLMLPEDRVERLREVPIWLDLDHPLGNLQYHPDAGWLKRNGHDTAMAKSVHIPTAERLITLFRKQSQPAVILHELAHAYHDRVLDFDHPPIRGLYDEAVESGKYESVLQGRGKHQKHYALTNHKEFFAEMTESFLSTNDFYPFVRAELLEHDPPVAKLLEQIWLKPQKSEEAEAPPEP